MICIIKNVDLYQSNLISEYLNKCAIENIVSNDEQKILSSDKIIIPDTSNLSESLRKLKLMNMINILKLITKPILGINQGMILMCSNIAGINKTGLGLIDSETIKLNSQIDGYYFIENHSNEKKTVLLEKSDTQYYFKTELMMPNIAGCRSVINLSNNKYTAIYQKNNIYGLQICLADMNNAGCELLKAFSKS